MTHITGTLTVSDAAIPFTHWRAFATRISDGALVGSSAITTSGTTPVDYSIPCGTETGACLVTICPALGSSWEQAAPMGQGGFVVPTDSAANPYVFQATSVSATADALAANVVFYAHLDSDFTDTEGLTLTVDDLTQIVGDKPPQVVDGSGSALFTSDTASGTSGLKVTDASISPGTSDFTLEFWVKPTDSTGAEQPVVRLYEDVNDLTTLSFANNTLGGSFVAQVTSAGNFVHALVGALTDNVWHHVAYNRSGSYHSLYINGVLADENPSADVDFAPAQSLSIGHGGLAYYDHFDGNICRVRLTIGVMRYDAPFTPPIIFSGTPGQTGTAEPIWPTTVSGTVTDGDVTWTNIGRMVQPVTHGWLVPG